MSKVNSTSQPVSPQSNDVISDKHRSSAEISGTSPRHIFHPHVSRGHVNVWRKTAIMILFLSVGVLGVFSVFWGAMFHRTERAHNLKVAVINWDGGIVGQSFEEQYRERPEAKTLISMSLIPPDMYTSTEQVEALVVQFNYWGVFVVKGNATESTAAILEGSEPRGESQISYYYASARQESIHWTYITPQMTSFQAKFLEEKVPSIEAAITMNYSDTQLAQIIRNRRTAPIRFETIDVRPFTNGVASAIDNVGLIYLIIISFYQIMMWNLIHAIMVPYDIVFWQRFLYKICINMFSVLIVSLSFSLVSLAFQQDFSVAYGRAGFVVYWMVNYLAMLALGGATDNIQILFARYFPPILPLWLLLWVIINTATAMFPLEVSPQVYQYGKAMPLYNTVEAIRTILFDVKSSIGLNVGILLIWIVVNWSIAFVGLWNNERLLKKKAAERDQQDR